MANRRDVFRRGLKLSANLALLVISCVSWQGDCLDTHNSSLGSSGILITASQCQYVKWWTLVSTIVLMPIKIRVVWQESRKNIYWNILNKKFGWVSYQGYLYAEFLCREWQKNYRAASGSSSKSFALPEGVHSVFG